MKQPKIWFACTVMLLLVTSIFPETALAAEMDSIAGSLCTYQDTRLNSSERHALLLSCLAKASAPANVRSAAFNQKLAYCKQNALNKNLQNDEKSRYMTACIDNNEAQMAYHASQQRLALRQINELLQDAPTAAGSE